MSNFSLGGPKKEKLPNIGCKRVPNQVKNLCKMLTWKRASSSFGEESFIEIYIDKIKGMQMDGFGNRYIVIGRDIPTVLFSCHTDTVHYGGKYTHYGSFQSGKTDQSEKGWKQNIAIDPNSGIIMLNDKGSNCLGADDAAGVFIMTRMIEADVPGLYVFHREEENGGDGSDYFVENFEDLLKPINYAIAFDRKGKRSIITHQRGESCCSIKFASGLAKELNSIYGPNSDKWVDDPTGTFTDTANYVDVVSECTNISVGYERQHTSNEVLHYPSVIELLNACKQIKWDKLPVDRDPKSRPTRYYHYGSSLPEPIVVPETILTNDNIFSPEWGDHEYIIEADDIDEQFIIDNADILVDYFKEQALTKTDLEQDLARLATPHLT
jgi:hypothetical protein